MDANLMGGPSTAIGAGAKRRVGGLPTLAQAGALALARATQTGAVSFAGSEQAGALSRELNT